MPTGRTLSREGGRGPTRRARAAALVGFLLTVGCGGGDSSDACGKVAPCGGDLVGAWTLTSTCTTRPVLPGKLCDAATVTHSSFQVSGKATFGADHSFGISATESGTIEVSVPASCLVGAGDATASCAELTPTVPAGVGARCDPSGDGCHCTFIIPAQDVAEVGTYTASGSSLKAAPAGGLLDGASYCVAGDRLHLVSLGASAGAAKPPVVSDLVGRSAGPKN
jgi:hypothetical protein